MQKNNVKIFENMDTKTKVYLVVIAISLILLCVNVMAYIIPSIILYAVIIIYTIWVYNKRVRNI